MALSQTPGSMGAPTNGISDTITRNTHQDTNSQKLVGPIPQFGQWDVSRLGTQSNYPASSSHWQQWFEGGASLNWATGKPQQFLSNPDPTPLIHMTTFWEHTQSAGAVFPGVTWLNQFTNDWLHPHNTATGKIQQPYAQS